MMRHTPQEEVLQAVAMEATVLQRVPPELHLLALLLADDERATTRAHLQQELLGRGVRAVPHLKALAHASEMRSRNRC